MKNLSFVLSVLFAAATLGCGPAGQRFHGTYNATGTDSYTTPGAATQTGQIAVPYRISEGTISDIVITEAAGSCALPADVEGDVATLRPGTTCTSLQNNGATVTRILSNGVMTFTGKAIQLHISGNLTLTQDGQTYPGTFTQNATLTRIGK